MRNVHGWRRVLAVTGAAIALLGFILGFALNRWFLPLVLVGFVLEVIGIWNSHNGRTRE